MKKIILVIVSFAFALTVFSQKEDSLYQDRPLNNIALNLLGDISVFSLNYERQIVLKSNIILSGKLGIGYNDNFILCIFPCSSEEKYLTIPHHVTFNYGKNQHFLEFGFGGTLVSGNTSKPYLLYPIIGYRILPLRPNKISFRLFINIPFSGTDFDDYGFSAFGINIGYSF